MFLATRRRLALWYTIVTAVLLLLFASGVYLYVRTTLIERIDDTLNHVVEVVQRSLVIEPVNPHQEGGPVRVNLEASFRDNAGDVDDDHIDLEWFSAQGQLLWSSLAEPLQVPLHPNVESETVAIMLNPLWAGSPPTWRLAPDALVLRQVTHRVQVGRQVLGYLRVSHPWFEVTKPSRQLVVDLSIGISIMVTAAGTIGWLLSGLAIEPVQASYQRLKQFTADASHELRNPIATIQTNVQVALLEVEPDPQVQAQQLRVVERLTRRLGQLVDDLLFLARQDSGMIEPQMTEVNLLELLHNVVEEQQVRAAELGITLQFMATLALVSSQETRVSEVAGPGVDQGCLIQGDRNQLARLATNLISNALQFTMSGGSVQVTLHRVDYPDTVDLARSLNKPMSRLKPPYWQLSVQDTGIGIARDALPQLFDRFYRADPARSRSQGAGSGLGLAIVYAIVQAHHGHIWVESQLHQGSTFHVAFPTIGA